MGLGLGQHSDIQRETRKQHSKERELNRKIGTPFSKTHITLKECMCYNFEFLSWGSLVLFSIQQRRIAMDLAE